jgi:hypothetical protein
MWLIERVHVTCIDMTSHHLRKGAIFITRQMQLDSYMPIWLANSYACNARVRVVNLLISKT